MVSITTVELNLKHLLRRYGVKQGQLAKSVGCTKSTVSDWVNGAKWPTPENLGRIIDALKFLGTSEVVEALPVKVSDLFISHESVVDVEYVNEHLYELMNSVGGALDSTDEISAIIADERVLVNTDDYKCVDIWDDPMGDDERWLVARVEYSMSVEPYDEMSHAGFSSLKVTMDITIRPGTKDDWELFEDKVVDVKRIGYDGNVIADDVADDIL